LHAIPLLLQSLCKRQTSNLVTTCFAISKAREVVDVETPEIKVELKVEAEKPVYSVKE